MDIPKINQIDFNKIDDPRVCKLDKMSIIQLKEVIARQERILKNQKYFTEALPDGGEKIVRFHQKAVNILKNRELTLESTTSLLSKLKIGANLDPKHPIAESATHFTSHVDPYASVLSEALDETCQEEKFKPNQSRTKDKDEAKNDNIGDKKLEKYQDSALQALPPSRPLAKLSLVESIEMCRVQAEREKKISIIRKIELYNKYNDKLDELMDEEEYADDFENDTQGHVNIVKYE